jgi:hypothetical protein
MEMRGKEMRGKFDRCLSTTVSEIIVFTFPVFQAPRIPTFAPGVAVQISWTKVRGK